MDFYRTEENLAEHRLRDPFPVLHTQMLEAGFAEAELLTIEAEARDFVQAEYDRALTFEDPRPEDLTTHVFAPTPITEEKGERAPAGKEPTVMVDSALFAIRELMDKHPECLLYGQDVGRRLGGVFREAATLAERFGDHRVFNTPIQEAFIIGSTVGMSAAGLRPIVEVQFADYIYPAYDQVVSELARLRYRSASDFTAPVTIRTPCGGGIRGGQRGVHERGTDAGQRIGERHTVNREHPNPLIRRVRTDVVCSGRRPAVVPTDQGGRHRGPERIGILLEHLGHSARRVG
jgi:2-oxoisovalerate dehydrogenase E1 component